MNKIKPFVLPSAIVLGLLLHDACAALAFIVPYVIFAILLLTFSSIELRKLRFARIDLWLSVVQIALAVIFYAAAASMTSGETIPQGLMMAALCPVASSVTVVAAMLGAKRENTIGFTIVGNLLVSALAPVFFVFLGHDEGTNITDSFFAIFGRISTVIGLPFFVMLLIQLWVKPVARKIKQYASGAFYLWAVALLMTLGQTIDYIFLYGAGHWSVIAVLGAGAMVICALQFAIGRAIGRHCGDTVGGQQLLGQKNTAMGIWMANTYLNPLASTTMAFYSIAQNLFNSWQLWRVKNS